MPLILFNLVLHRHLPTHAGMKPKPGNAPLIRNKIPCPILSASFCGMGGKPGTSDFPKALHAPRVRNAGGRLVCKSDTYNASHSLAFASMLKLFKMRSRAI